MPPHSKVSRNFEAIWSVGAQTTLKRIPLKVARNLKHSKFARGFIVSGKDVHAGSALTDRSAYLEQQRHVERVILCNVQQRVRLLFVLSLLSIGAFTDTTVAGSLIPSFSSLSKHDEVRIEFRSVGCWHERFARLTVVRARGITFVVLQPNELPRETKGIDSKSRKKRIRLEDDELRGLDELVEYYRHLPTNGKCTTVDRVSLTHLREGVVAASESFTDRTGDLYGYKNPAITDIGQLLNRLQ
jgi:hypothetical protein